MDMTILTIGYIMGFCSGAFLVCLLSKKPKAKKPKAKNSQKLKI